MNTALEQLQTSLDGVDLQLAKVDTMTTHARNVTTANVGEPGQASVSGRPRRSPLVKVAAFGYGVRARGLRPARGATEHDVRDTIEQQRRAAKRGNG